ncbi:MAG: Fic family protein [Culicoidibacterales bacterium]
MSYIDLRKHYYTNHETHNECYLARYNSPSTIKLPLFIKTKYGDSYQLFVMVLPEFIQLIESIENKIHKRPFLRQTDEPKAFVEDYVNKLMIDEIIKTNEIEGVYTKKEELVSVIKNIDNDELRFHFIVNKYQKILNNKEIILATPQDIRNIYDDLLTNEIAQSDIPDGKIFRKGKVSVHRRSGKSLPIHEGLFPEDNITNAISNLLLFLAESDCPFYLKVAIGHYYFGYIHPFYDGNGRLSRFISTALISQNKDKLLGFKLSKIIKDSIRKYDEAFDLANSPYNRGDLTEFVLMFLRVLDAGCTEITTEMESYTSRLNQIKKFLDQHGTITRKVEKNIIFLIYQAEMIDNKITIKDIATYLNKSADMTRKNVDKICEKKYINKEKKGTRYYLSLTTAFEVEMREFFTK